MKQVKRNSAGQLKLTIYEGSLEKLKTSRGRKYKNDPDNPFLCMNPWELDKSKILQSKALRRAPEKMQVHSLHFNPHIRNRFVHTAEAVSISIQIASILDLNVPYCEAIAWGHDLGHFPYGHNAESFFGLKHALNGAVILAKIERKGRGLNLTWETMNGILCHTRGKKGLWDGSKPNEINVLIIADWIAYIFADLDDLFRLVTLNNNSQSRLIIPGISEVIRESFENDLPEEVNELGTGPNARRRRVLTCINAVIGESLEKQRISFSESATAKKFNTIRDWMYEKIYHALDYTEERRYQRENLKIVCEYFERECLAGNLDPKFVISLMTDKEVGWLAKILREDNPHEEETKKIYQLSAMEIVKSLNGKEINHKGNPLW